MEPTKKRNSSDRIFCEAPAKKVPEPPVSNDDTNKSSILKAFEAIVAAGKRGLLGPTAMAAVEAMPDLDLKCCDEKADQETPSSSPLVEEKKEEGEEEKTVVDIECNSDVDVTPPIKGTESVQCPKKEIWICGDSVITLSRMRAQFSYHGVRLGLRPYKESVYWRGIPTMMWDDLLPTLHHIYHNRDSPSIIAIHLGENDLLIDSRDSLVTRIQSDLDFIRRAFPDVIIIWSSLLPKHVWKPSEESQVVESERNNVNHKMKEYCNEKGINYLSHPLITGENKSLFLPDNTLSNEGADIFVTDLRKILNTSMGYNSY